MTARSPLWHASLLSSTSTPMRFDQAAHDRILNRAAAAIWPTLAPHIRDLMDKETRKPRMMMKPRSLGMSTMVAHD